MVLSHRRSEQIRQLNIFLPYTNPLPETKLSIASQKIEELIQKEKVHKDLKISHRPNSINAFLFALIRHLTYSVIKDKPAMPGKDRRSSSANF